MSDFPDRKAWEAYRDRPTGQRARWAHPLRTTQTPEGPVLVSYDRSRNAEKAAIPASRKTRVRLRAFLEGKLTGRPLTDAERSYLK